jgi:hypothetical protein
MNRYQKYISSAGRFVIKREQETVPFQFSFFAENNGEPVLWKGYFGVMYLVKSKP